MDKAARVAQARKMNHLAIRYRQVNQPQSAALAVDFRNLNMRYARKAKK